MFSSRPPYSGSTRQLILAIDVGTTFSGVSYCVLDPGTVPQTQGVTRYPAQETSGGNSKIPSVIFYDDKGQMRAAGAEALSQSNMERGEREGWQLLQWWKLLIAPKDFLVDGTALSPPILPLNKSIVDVFADFLGYLLRCTKQYIIETQSNGESLWNSTESEITYVLTHPNGWEGAQQNMMKEAAIHGGLVPDTDRGRERVTFVTEGEASFNFCATSNLSADAFRMGRNIVVIDAGGGTIDLSAYSITSATPLSVSELFAPECLMQGSEFVTFRAGDYIREKLKSSKFDTPDDFRNIIERFDSSSKRIFADENESLAIRFGSPRDSDPGRGINRGQMKLTGFEAASFFKECIESVVETITKHFEGIARGTTNVFLVGGFAASPWLFNRLRDDFNALGLMLSRPDGHTNKAVADGAISFYLDHFVTARISKYTYGTKCCRQYNPLDNGHLLRASSCFTRASGEVNVPGSFDVILTKGRQVAETKEFSSGYYNDSRKAKSLNKISADIICYKGGSMKTEIWMDSEPQSFSTLCYVEANTSKVPKVPISGSKGTYFSHDYRIVLLFGLTELRAQISWTENGVEKRSPAKVVYSDDAI